MHAQDTPLRILITSSTYPRWENDGIPMFVHEFAQEMATRGHEVRVLAPHTEGAAVDELLDGIRIHRFRYWPSPAGQTLAYDGAPRRLRRTPLTAIKLLAFIAAQTVMTWRIARSLRADLINPHWIVPQGFTAALAGRTLRVPIIPMIHGSDVHTLNSPIMRWFKRFTLRSADAVVVNSSSTLRAATRISNERPYRTIPMGVDHRRIRPAEPLPGAGLRVLFVGRLSTEKGVAVLIDALAQLRDLDVHVTILGEGSEAERLRRQARRLGVEHLITWAGWVDRDHLPEYFAASDVFVGPSVITSSGHQEAFGLVFVESLLMETPVIGTRIGGISDIITDGVNGLLVPHSDAPALATAIRRFADDPNLAAELTSGARAEMIERFSWDAVGHSFENLFREVVSGRHTAGRRSRR